eukprot:gene15816-biopygen5450
MGRTEESEDQRIGESENPTNRICPVCPIHRKIGISGDRGYLWILNKGIWEIRLIGLIGPGAPVGQCRISPDSPLRFGAHFPEASSPRIVKRDLLLFEGDEFTTHAFVSESLVFANSSLAAVLQSDGGHHSSLAAVLQSDGGHHSSLAAVLQ